MTFRPRVEALDPRILPDATPLSPIVGPFAPGMYPTEPPPAAGHHHEWVDDLNERSAQHLANLEAREQDDEAQYVQLREQPGMAAALRTALQQALDRERAIRDAEVAAASRDWDRYQYYHDRGQDRAAREHRLLAIAHDNTASQMAVAIGLLQDVLNLDNSQIVVAANDHLTLLRDSSRAFEQAADQRALALDGTFRTARAFRIADAILRGQEHCYTQVQRAITQVARQFGQ
jgi:hypothetical protein